MDDTVLTSGNGFELFDLERFRRAPKAERERLLALMASPENKGKCASLITEAQAIHQSLR